MKKLICCICGEEITHPMIDNYFGNNPFPISNKEEDRCCDRCNDEVVVPQRIMDLLNSRNK